jgi:hypothetical protein
LTTVGLASSRRCCTACRGKDEEGLCLNIT